MFSFFFFSYNQTDFYASPGPRGVEFKGPLWHPLRLLSNLATWNMFVLVPVFYCAIFKFRRSHDLTAGTYISGLVLSHEGRHQCKIVQTMDTFEEVRLG